MSSETNELGFPPRLSVGSRVWSGDGYREHGPMEGPKVNIAVQIGGTVTAVTGSYMTMDNLLYAVRWDDGTTSKHYANGLTCIGRFQSLTEFDAAIQIEGPIEVTVGPQGGFREAKFTLIYDGRRGAVRLGQGDRDVWNRCVLPKVREQNLPIVETRLPGKKRAK